jgi:hypothetical protein
MMSNLKRPASEWPSPSATPPRKRPVPDASQPDFLTPEVLDKFVGELHKHVALLKLCDSTRDSHVEANLRKIYSYVRLCADHCLEDVPGKLVGEDSFVKTKQWAGLLDLVKEAIKKGDKAASKDDWEAVIIHRTYIQHGMNRIIMDF